ncbi:hypothetical protein BGX21_009366 [Mortierella sp. AD011]|nr:hypothetical protein BGX20_010815 [Mortierella sp. AD010]KAF9396894.1 hypothetical protein BGX21_009366 [Mortierella sp. AD011]
MSAFAVTPSTQALASAATPSPSPLPRPVRALELPEILSLIGRYLSQRDALSCVLVSRTWHDSFQPVLWGHVETANEIPPEDIISHARYIRSLSLADLTGLEMVLEKCTRLETLILWPDAFENEEDEEDEDDEMEDEDEENIVREEVASKANVLTLLSGGRENEPQGSGSSSSSNSIRTTELSQSPQPPPAPHPVGQQGLGLDTTSSNRIDSVATKVRRDSGVGDDTVGVGCIHKGADWDSLTKNPSAITTIEENMELLSVQEQKSALALEIPSFSQSKPQSQLTNLILRNRNITRVEVYVERKSPGGSFWRALAVPPTSPWCPCPRLSAFQSLVNLQVYKHIKPFLQMCTRLESLDLERCSLRQLDDSYYTSLDFSKMKELRFGRIKDTSLQTQLLIMQRCPELRSLEWRVPRLGFPVQEFCESLRTSWPKLTTLVLPESRLTDSELAQIVVSSGCAITVDTAKSMTGAKASSEDRVYFSINNRVNCSSPDSTKGKMGLTRFEARRSDFAHESFRALKERGHFKTLRNLDLYQCPGLASWMIAEILCGCPLLESFDGHQLFAQHIVPHSNSNYWSNNRNNNHNSKDNLWVCRGMRYLDLHFTGFSNEPEHDVERQWQVFAQLARLENLVYLSIGGKSARVPPVNVGSRYGNGGLDLRLRSGLGQLCTLKKLRMLRFTGAEQQMTVEDIMWMIENLPELKIVQGKLHPDQVEQEKLERLLESNKISAWTMYNQPYGAGYKRQQQQQQHQQQQMHGESSV